MISKSRHARFSSLTIGLWVAVTLLGIPVRGATAPDLEVRGNRTLSDGTIRSLMQGVQWSGEGDEPVVRRVQEAYIRRGYLFASIHLERSSADSTIQLVIDEGEAARTSRVAVYGAAHFDEATVRHTLRIEEGEPFAPDAVDRGMRDLLQMYDGQGFPFAQVWIDSLQLDPDQSDVSLTVHIVEGGTKKLSRIEVEGLEKTKEDVAVRLSGLHTGEPYDGERIRDAYLRLESSGVFEEVAYPTIRISPQGGGVEALIKVVESKRSNSFTAALGYAEQAGRSESVLSGVVSLELLNIGGGLRDFNIFWRSDGAGRIQTELGFQQQFFLGHRMNLGVSLQQIGQDTVYTWQSIGVETGLPLGRLWNGMLGVDFAVHGDRNTFALGDVSNSLRLRLTGGYSYLWGRKHRGTFIGWENQFTYADKKMNYRDDPQQQSVSQYIVTAMLRSAFQLRERMHIANRTVFQQLTSDEGFVPLSEQFYIGGAATVRGYRENQFHSPLVAYSRTEFLVGRSRLENGYVFADVGYYAQQYQPGLVAAKGRVLAGFGVGLRTQSRAGNVDLSFAVGDEYTLRQTKIHLILNRSF